MKFIFFGTPYVARDTLATLCAHGYRPEAVVTNPDAPSGRGQLLTPSPTNVFATEQNIPVHTPDVLDNAFLERVNAYGAEAAIVVAYGKIFPQSLIESFPLGAINVHYSLLPKYRGAAPVEHALRNGETETGVTIQLMVLQMDAGDVLAQERIAIDPMDTTSTLRPKLITAGAELLVSLMPQIAEGTLVPIPQNHDEATYAPKLRKEDAELTLTPEYHHTNWNKYRAFKEWSGVYFFTERNGTRIRVKVTEATLTDDGVFLIQRVIPEGKKEMDYETFLQQ